VDGPEHARSVEEELRLRTAMELHDGILQTLTGASLQVAVARRLVQTDPAGAEKVLAELADTLLAEQQQMRFFVDEMKGLSPFADPAGEGVLDSLEALLERVSAIWGLETSVAGDLVEDPPAATIRQLIRIVQEATVNAARHGGARRISVHIAREGADVALRIEDDGHGFPFLGDLDMAALKERRLGPLSLKHRVQECGGRLAIRSTRAGATVSIWLPW
jgi:signal transduction histidine kinase